MLLKEIAVKASPVSTEVVKEVTVKTPKAAAVVGSKKEKAAPVPETPRPVGSLQLCRTRLGIKGY